MSKRQTLSGRHQPAADTLPGFRMTARDIAILETLLAYRELSTSQVETLLFSPSLRSKCKERLMLLFLHGFLERTINRLSMKREYIYWLSRTGAQFVADRQGIQLFELDWKPNDRTLRPYFRDHLLACNDVRIAITQAAAAHGYTIEEWQDDTTLKRVLANEKVTIRNTHGDVETVSIQPDGYFVLNTGTKRLKRFVEVDRQTMTLDGKGEKTWARRMRGYLAWFHSAAYEQRYGSKAGGLLTITIGEKRMANMKTVTEQAGGKARFWFTTLDKVTPDAVLTKPIWTKASAEGRYALVEQSATP